MRATRETSIAGQGRGLLGAPSSGALIASLAEGYCPLLALTHRTLSAVSLLMALGMLPVKLLKERDLNGRWRRSGREPRGTKEQVTNSSLQSALPALTVLNVCTVFAVFTVFARPKAVANTTAEHHEQKVL